MVTKGIITSIDFNGNTCQVRIPLFETAGNDPIISTAVVSNTPGSYNGYKVGDVVLVAFEDGKMETPVVIGKLYLGAEKEKADPRGSLNTESLVAAKTAAVPADTKLTTDTDKNLPNTMNPYANLSSIANNLNKLNTDVNYLDVFTNNQFSSVITDVNKQGEQLRSEIKQTANNIEANVVHTHENGTQKALGWDLTTDNWKINAHDTVTDENGETKVKDINIVTIDRNGMSIAGDLKLSGYPRNITVLYAQTGPNENYPKLYDFTEVEFPTPFPSGDEDKDKTWYYGKYIKIDENYVLIFKENFEHYKKLIDLGITKAYNREINPKWKTETPARVDGQYIWQWTHTEIYSFDGNKWSEKDDDKIACITGADGKDGAPGKDGYTTVTVMLYKRSKTFVSDNPISDELYYKFSDQKLYTNADCTTEYTLPASWSYTISDAGDSSNGDLYCIAAIANSNTDSDSIPHSEWAGPTLYVENGTDGQPGVYIKEVKQWYKLAAKTDNDPTKPTTDIVKSDENGNPTHTTDEGWSDIPLDAINDMNLWTSLESIFSDDIPSEPKKRHIEFSDPVKDAAYALAQGKTTNYYSPTEPIYNIKKGDCWFDTGYANVGALKNKTDYLGKFVISTTGDILVEQDENDSTRYIPNAAGSTKLIKVTPENIDTLIKNKTIVVNTTEAFETGNLKQCSSLDANGKATWTDIAGELVTNKLTANYIDALDITTNKIHVNDTNGNTLFKANGIPGEEDSNQVTIGGFSVTKDALVGGKINTQNYCKLNILDTFKFKVGEADNKISSSSLVIKDSTWTQKCYNYYKDNAGKSGEITWKEAAYDATAGTESQQCLYNGFTTYKCNSDNALKNEKAGEPIISCMVLKPNKELIESKIKEALNIKDDESIPAVTFSTTLNLGISSPSYIDSTIDNNYDYIIASTPFSFADLGVEIGPDVTNKDQFIQDKIEEAVKAIVDLNVKETNVDNQGKHKLSTGIFTGDEKIQEYARATGPRSIGNLENLTKVIYPSLTTDHYIAIFMVNIQKTCFKVNEYEDVPLCDYDSSGNKTVLSNIPTDSTGSNYILPTYGYCCVPNSVEVALQTLEIGPNFKVKTDGTMFANNAFFTGAVNVPETAVIGGFNISKNTLTSSTLNIDSNKVTISSFKPLVLGSNFKLISAPDTIHHWNAPDEKIWKSKISSRNQLEVLGESSIRLSNTIAFTSAENASILLETKAKTDTTSVSQEIRVVTTTGTKLSPGFNLHFDNLIGTGGAVSINYFTRATITATVYSSSAANAEEEAAKKAYTITVYYKFGTTWSSTTLAIPEGKTSASTTVSASGTSTYPTYYGISKNSSSEAVIAGAVIAGTTDEIPPLKYTIYYKEESVSYIPEITANGSLTVKGDIKTTKALNVEGNIKTTGKLTAEGNVYGAAFYASSDRELKTNIENINLDSNLDKFYQQLQPVKFNFKTDLTAQHFGFIAQDLENALSIISTDNAAYSIVNKDDKTGYYRVNYNEMVALNAAQIKNIMNYIKDLQSQYEALKLKYKELEEKINENS